MSCLHLKCGRRYIPRQVPTHLSLKALMGECPKLNVECGDILFKGQRFPNVVSEYIDVHMSRADCHQNARVTLSAAAAEGRRMCRGRTVARTVAAQRWENLNFISLLSSPPGALGQAGQGAVIMRVRPRQPSHTNLNLIFIIQNIPHP